jgi:hypothetical protein
LYLVKFDFLCDLGFQLGPDLVRGEGSKTFLGEILATRPSSVNFGCAFPASAVPPDSSRSVVCGEFGKGLT